MIIENVDINIQPARDKKCKQELRQENQRKINRNKLIQFLTYYLYPYKVRR